MSGADVEWKWHDTEPQWMRASMRKWPVGSTESFIAVDDSRVIMEGNHCNQGRVHQGGALQGTGSRHYGDPHPITCSNEQLKECA